VNFLTQKEDGMGWDKLGSKKVLQISYVFVWSFYLYADAAAGIPNCPFTTEIH